VGEHAPHLGLWKEELEQRLRSAPALLESACRELLLEVPPSPAGAARTGDEADIDPDTAPLAEWEETRPEAAFLFRFVALSAVMPSLHVAGELLGKHLDSARAWPHGHCPVCGSLPLIGRLAGNWEGSEGARLHTCSFCLHEYRVPRLGCPFCLATPGEESRYYASDEEPGYLLDVCDSCHQYIKLADFRECDRPWLPALDDLISLALDAYARSQGYERPTLSAWGF
jgi:FdhE protein